MAYNKGNRRQSTNINDLFADTHQPPAAKPKLPWLKGGCLGIVLLTIAFAGGIFWFVRSMLKSEDSFSAEGQQVVFEYEGQNLMAGIVSYFTATQVTKSGGITTRRGSTSYWLLIRRLPGGELVAKRKIETEGLNGSNLQLLGQQEGKLWLMAGGLTAFSLPQLQPHPADIPADIREFIPTESRYVLLDPGSQVVWIDLLDGRKAWLNMRRSGVRLLPDEAAPAEPDATRRMAIRRQMTWSSHAYTEYLGWTDTLPDKRMLALLPDTTALRSVPANRLPSYHFRTNERVFLYESVFAISRRGDYIEPSEDNLQRIETTGFLQGGFLLNTGRSAPFRIGNDYLVLHRDLINDEANLLVTRLKPNGERWYTKTMMPVKNCKQIISHGRFIMMVGTADGAGPAKAGSDEVVCLNLDKGSLTRFSCWAK